MIVSLGNQQTQSFGEPLPTNQLQQATTRLNYGNTDNHQRLSSDLAATGTYKKHTYDLPAPNQQRYGSEQSYHSQHQYSHHHQQQRHDAQLMGALQNGRGDIGNNYYDMNI